MNISFDNLVILCKAKNIDVINAMIATDDFDLLKDPDVTSEQYSEEKRQALETILK